MSSLASSFQPLTDDQLPQFISSLPLLPEVADQLDRLDSKSKMRCLTVLHAKMHHQTIGNVSSYLAGIIRNEGRANPWSSDRNSWHQSPSPSLGNNRMRGVLEAARPLVRADRPDVGRASRPSWVSEIWPLVAQRPGNAMRRLSQVVGGEAVAKLQHLPSSIQLSILMSVLVNESAWAEPEAYLVKLAATIGHFPPLLSPLPSVVVRKKGQPVVAISLGPSLGAEWVHLRAAIEAVKGEFPDVYAHALHAWTGQSVFSKEYIAAVCGDVTFHSTAQGAAEALVIASSEWRAMEAVVLFAVTVPQISACTCGPVLHPEYHHPQGKDIWDMLHIMRTVLPLPDNRCAYVVLNPSTPAPVTSSLLDTAFGKSWTATSSTTRIPTWPWHVRSWPTTCPEDLRSWTSTPVDNDIFSAEARSMREGLLPAEPIEVPRFEEMETYNDRVFSDSHIDRPAPKSYDVLRVAPNGSSRTGFLNRGELSRLFGVDGWGGDTAHARLYPCCVRCDPLSGCPVAEGSSVMSVVCGHNRYCMHCEMWYRMLTESAPSPVLSLIAKVLCDTLKKTAPAGTVQPWSLVPPHSCDGQGCGCR